MTLHDALGGMRDLAQWFIWRLEWDGAEGKYRKTPCGLDGSVYRIDASLPVNWHQHQDAARAVVVLNAALGSDTSVRYALGFWLTQQCGYWFFDLDGVSNGDGILSEFAAAMVSGFPGALCEWSSSRRGVHIIGRCAQAIPAHRSRDIHKLHMEFYTEGRGIAFGLDGVAQGSADTLHDLMVAQLVRDYFPPRAVGDSAARAEWRGPADDDVLIERMLRAKISADVAFGGKKSLAQLWRGENISDEERSNADMALACHLAFWTGCDEERMERLMRRSGLVRAKWDEHRTYLRELTIGNACAQCSSVYQEPERNLAVAQAMYGDAPIAIQLSGVGEVITPEMSAKVKELLAAVAGCGTVEEMHNVHMAAIRGAGVPAVFQEQLVRAVNTKLDYFDSKLPVAKLRALLFPPVIAGARGSEAPLWLQQHCYVKDGDFFYNVENGARMTYQGFNAEYSRLMPIRESGGRENPAQWAIERWNITTVHHLGYRPDMGPYYQWDGLDYANLYSPSSVPATASEWTPEGLAGIEAFKGMLWDMCARREPVYMALLQWFAHNVQRPGVKIRWSPIIKGAPGDAKSIVTEVIRSVMGYRNVGVTGNSALRASGGFNDWAVGSALNVIEEIQLVGKERHQLFNAMLEFITNNVISINAKGRPTYKAWNTTNHLALTNHNDALPLPKLDRRWMVVFTPWESLPAMYAFCGLTQAQWDERTARVDYAYKNCAGELRAWFLSVDLAGFNSQGSALATPEKRQMMASSQDDAEGVAESIITDGVHGVGEKVLSSVCLSSALKIRAAMEGFEVPKSTALNHLLTRLGYSKISQQVKWKNGTHTIWVKNGVNLDNDGLRLELDKTSNPTFNLPN